MTFDPEPVLKLYNEAKDRIKRRKTLRKQNPKELF